VNATTENTSVTTAAIDDTPVQLSERFKDAVYIYTRKIRPQWQLASIAGVSPEALSRLINGRLPVRPGDPRIVRVGAVLGLEPDECFEA
jgi:hypothetical protein